MLFFVAFGENAHSLWRGESRTRHFFQLLKGAPSKWHRRKLELKRGNKTHVLKVGPWREGTHPGTTLGLAGSQAPNVRKVKDCRGRFTVQGPGSWFL